MSDGAIGGRKPYQSQVRALAPARRRRQRQSREGRPARRWRRRLVRTAVVIALCIAVSRQVNGAGGAFAADLLRAVVGPSATARIEATYLDLLDRIHAVQYSLGGRPVHAPWTVVSTTPAQRTIASRSRSSTMAVQPRAPSSPMPLPAIPAPISPTLPGEGVWTTAGLPAAGPGAAPPLAKTFLRPDPARPYALATLLQADLRLARLHMVAGTDQPGGPVGHPGSGLIPAADTSGDRLLAVFNGGFKYADGAYGLMSGGVVYVRPVWGAATVAVTRSGGVFMGAWGKDHRLTTANRGLVAWRQNAGLLIDRGRITAQTQDGSAWGLSILNSAYTWRSGIGLTKRGTLLYVAGSWLSAATLAQTLHAAGAVTAMQLDINPNWVRAFTYGRDGQGTLVAWALDPAMPGIGMEYMYGNARDFFYLTRAAG
ncbi:MAG TPA: phosphodiester glycosidase family protein [Chloroflexota bacterium]|nr:phosphodiester glycosidase family protein [Chloroflexota bacterium]